MADIAYMFDGEAKTILVTEGDISKPLILMLHGTGDSASAWSDPATHPDTNYDFDAPFPGNQNVGWHAYPGIGVRSFELDPKKDVHDWVAFFGENNYRTARYSQVDNTGLLARPVDEMGVVMDSLVAEFTDVPIVVLTQSRGGLLIRKFVKDNYDNALRVGQIRKIITLHGPHLGSELATIANDLHSAINAVRGVLPAAIGNAAFDWLDDVVDSEAYQELAADSDFIQDLAKGEAALPNVEYYTFAGTSVLASRIRTWIYTLSSSVPQWHLPPFQHRITLTEVPGISPMLDSLPNLVDEITPGKGDILVAETRAHLPWSVRRTNRINHAETYWDPALQNQVLRLLGENVGIWS